MKKLPSVWQRILPLALAGILVLLAMISGTMAWVDVSQHKTNVAEGSGPPKPADALLQKYETGTERPIPGATFGLYKIETDDTAVLIETYVTGANGQIQASGLKPGNYYWQESHPPAGFSPELEDGQAKKYPFSISAREDEPVRAVAHNSRRLGRLIVTKTVAGEGADLEREFEFTAVIGGIEQIFTLKHGQQKIFEDIPVGALYEILETPVPGYIITSENNAGNVPEAGVTAAFTNTCNVLPSASGSLTVSKTVTGEGADLDKAFHFAALISGEEETFALKHGQSKTFSGIPLGTAYSVTETAAEGYISNHRQYSGTIQVSGAAVILPFVNHYEGDGPPELLGSLEITKRVVGGDIDPDTEFIFAIAFAGDGAPASPQSFSLKHGEKKSFADIPRGVSYTVTETDAGGNIPAFTVVTGMIAGAQTTAAGFVNYVPPEKLRLTVTKRVEGNPGDSSKMFRFALNINGVAHEFDLRPGETSEGFIVFPGDAYSLAERNYLAEGYLQTVVTSGAGTVGGASIEILKTNTYIGPETIDIEGEKTWQSPSKLPDSVTIRLKNGNVIVRTAAITQHDNWRYEFKQLPKRDAMGNMIAYVVEEVRIPGWRPAVTGFDIRNYHQPPVIDAAIEVEKSIVGTSFTDAAFTFVLTPLGGAPVPANQEVSVTGAGKVSFGRIAYSMPGQYIYTITEINGGLQNWSYDASVYTLTVTVTEDNSGQLTIDRALAKADQPAEKALFVNRYDESGETLHVRVTKNWQGGDTGRPQSVLVQLYKDGTPFGSPTTLSAANNWSRVWSGLEKGRVWTVDEASVPQGYTKMVSGDAVNGFTITNIKTAAIPEIETTSVKVTKVWRGENENRPASVAVQLYKEGMATGVPMTLSEANGWTYTWNQLEKGPAWTADEINVPQGYTKAVIGDAANGFVITNTKLHPSQLLEGEVIVSGKKTWHHGENTGDRQPEAITVMVVLKGDGAIVTQRLITANDHWAWAFVLPKYNSEGKEIVYTVNEARIEDYWKTVDGHNLINTYSPGANTDDSYPGGPAGSGPQTDDTGNLGLWLMLMGLSFCGLAVIIFMTARKKWRN